MEQQEQRSNFRDVELLALEKVNKIWYEELIEILRSNWKANMQWEEIIRLRKYMEDILSEVRMREDVKPLFYECSCCDFIGTRNPPKLTITRLLNGVEDYVGLPKKTIKNLKANWILYSRNNSLDKSYGFKRKKYS